MEGRHLALHEPDRGRHGLLHRQGLARPGHLQGLERGQRIAIPLRGTRLPTGTLRIILQDDGQVAVHSAVDEDTACSTKPCGTATVGVDKGCTEAYTDSDGHRHGEEPGDLLAAESDRVKNKGQKRNQLRSIEKKHRAAGRTQKADNIRRHNLGDRKWDNRKRIHNAQVRAFLCSSTAPAPGPRPPVAWRPG